MRLLSIIAAASLGISLVSHSFASDPYWDGVVILDESVPGGTALNPLSVGIDLGDGSGFSFLTLTDPNAEGMIQLPPLPVGGQLAVGVHDDYGDEPDDICLVARVGDWAVGVTIEFPLLASMTPGASLGVDYGVLATPPIELMPGDRFTVTDGLLPGWQGIRLVDDSGVQAFQDCKSLLLRWTHYRLLTANYGRAISCSASRSSPNHLLW